MPSDDDLCREVALLKKNILGTGVVVNGKLVSSYIKPNVPLPNEKRLGQMLMQSHFLTAIAKSNDDFFGRFGYMMVHWDGSDVFFFVLDESLPKLFLIRVVRPYDHEELMEGVSYCLKKFDYG